MASSAAAAVVSSTTTSSRKVLHVAGHATCGFFRKTVAVLNSMSLLFPHQLKVVPHEFVDRSAYRAWLIGRGEQNEATTTATTTTEATTTSTATSTLDGSVNGFRTNFPSPAAAREHATSPFCWFSKTDKDSPDVKDIDSYLGGCDDTLEWCRRQFTIQQNQNGNNNNNSNNNNNNNSHENTVEMVNDGYVKNHGYDYDLIVIGGGSGGMAAAKEAASFGANVACLDFVKPSPAGTTWGLGGTCVNVGCIPKKLYHAAALCREAIHFDTPAFGITIGKQQQQDDNDNQQTKDSTMMMMAGPPPAPTTTVSWNTLVETIRNYIRSLNFKYRVRLREKNVKYLNKLATFVDPHTITAVDKHGQSTTITAARFLVATGGRPTPLSCPGHELAISSDDIFFLDRHPGKTLCVGASYISLECAGFLQGLGCDVTVAVRSILLRGFDRECTDRIDQYMSEHGVNFKRSVTPTKLERIVHNDPDNADADNKTNQQRIRVTFSDGTIDDFDTVLVAIGRTADTSKLAIDQLGVQLNPKNGKIIATAEQTHCPNIYAVGDVLDGSPELTPVAIQAGILLARRMFGNSKEAMDYRKVCTTVFTPIEYSCVGLSEDDAVAELGADRVEVYHREFQPLEWSVSVPRSHSMAFTKVIVDKSNPNDERVIGMHYVGPNAGEVMQGYGVAIKQGLSMKQLTDTVGIHPTCSEEIVGLSITKSSGEDAAAGGC